MDKRLKKNFKNYVGYLASQTHLKVYSGEEIQSIYNHLIAIHTIIDTGNTMIVLFSNFEDRVSMPDVNRFVECCSFISKEYKKKCAGVYITLLENNNSAVSFSAYDNSNCTYTVIHSNTITELLNNLLVFLYVNNVYLYQNDDVYMITNNIDELIENFPIDYCIS